MPKNDDKTNDKPDEPQTVAVNANDTANDVQPPTEDKPHRKSNYITLAPGQAHEVAFPVAQTGSSVMVPLSATQGQVFHIVPDDSTEVGVGETLAASLLERRLFVYADKPKDDAQYEGAPPAPETPAGAKMAAQRPASEFAAYVGPPAVTSI